MADKENNMPLFLEEFDKYMRLGEQDKIEKINLWRTAIGLQQVDGLWPSAYLIELATKNIKGEITFNEIQKLLDRHYATKHTRPDDGVREEKIRDFVSGI